MVREVEAVSEDMLVGLWYFVEGVVHLDHVNIVGEGGGYGFGPGGSNS